MLHLVAALQLQLSNTTIKVLDVFSITVTLCCCVKTLFLIMLLKFKKKRHNDECSLKIHHMCICSLIQTE